jgi:hypothetical protein
MLTAFARTIFRLTGQDQIKVSVPVNLRSPAEREVAGMYVLPVPVVIERPRDAASERRFAAGVGSALLRAMIRRQRSTGAGPEAPTDLAVLYQKMSGLGGREFFQWGTADYLPRVGYSTRGVTVVTHSYPDVVDVQALLDPGVFSSESAKGVSEALRRNLTSDSDQGGQQSA